MKKGISFLAAMILPVLAFASEKGGDHGWFSPIWGIPAVVWQFINLTLVAGLFYYLLRWRLPNVLRKRTVEIESALETARKEKKESLAKLKELEDKMARLEDEVAKIETEKEGGLRTREKARLTDEARTSAEWLRKRRNDEFSRERERTRGGSGHRRGCSTQEWPASRSGKRCVRTDEERLDRVFSKDIRDRAEGCQRARERLADSLMAVAAGKNAEVPREARFFSGGARGRAGFSKLFSNPSVPRGKGRMIEVCGEVRGIRRDLEAFVKAVVSRRRISMGGRW